MKTSSNITEKYIYAVTKQIPEQQRDEIAKELRALIGEMLDERGGSTPENENAVLMELGNPSAMAASYKGKENYVIGPGLYDTYIKVLKISIPIMLVLTLVGIGVDAATTDQDFFSLLIYSLAEMVNMPLLVIGTMTLLFGIIERSVKVELVKEFLNAVSGTGEWNPSNLPDIPDNVKSFGKVEVVLGLVFTLLFAVWVNRGFPVGTFDLLNYDALLPFLPAINIYFALRLLFVASKLAIRKWNYTLALANLLLNVVFVLLVMWVLDSGNIFNIPFDKIAGYVSVTNENLMYWWDINMKILGVVIIGIIGWDSAEGFYGAWKVGKSRS